MIDAMRSSDKAVQVYEEWDRHQRSLLRKLITPELIEEHRLRPLGQHSDELERVLAYFRRQPAAGKEVIVATRAWEEYRIAELSGRRGEPAEVLAQTFPSEEVAMHAVFLRRVSRLMESE